MWPPFSDLPVGRTPARPAAPHAAPIDEARLVEAMEAAHVFPGYYPIVVIARDDDAFRERLHATLGGWDAGDPAYRVTEQPSSRGAYVSFRVEIFVDSARMALDRKAVIAEISGVLMML